MRPGIARRHLFHDREGAIRRTVVAEQDLERLVILRESPGDGIADQGLLIVGDDCERHEVATVGCGCSHRFSVVTRAASVCNRRLGKGRRIGVDAVLPKQPAKQAARVRDPAFGLDQALAHPAAVEVDRPRVGQDAA